MSSITQKFQILVSDRFNSDAFVRLTTQARFAVSRATSPELASDDLSLVEGLIIRSRTPITRALLSRAPKLKVIVTSTSGFDHIDLSLTTERQIVVMFTPEANAASAAELTWGLVLACARKLPWAQRAVETGDWSREQLMGTQLSGKTYGVIGLGRIGSRVATIAQAFGLKTIAYDPYQDEDQFKRFQCERVGLDELLKLSDVISCHVPATKETHHMISKMALIEGNDGRLFVNTSRGNIIAETVLVEALDEGWIGACGLDVFEREPLAQESKLLKRGNVVVTPHIGATTNEAFRAASFEAAEKMIAFAERGIVADELPGSQPWLTSINSL